MPAIPIARRPALECAQQWLTCAHGHGLLTTCAGTSVERLPYPVSLTIAPSPVQAVFSLPALRRSLATSAGRAGAGAGATKVSSGKQATTGFEDSDASNSAYRMNQPTTSILDDPASLFQSTKKSLTGLGQGAEGSRYVRDASACTCASKCYRDCPRPLQLVLMRKPTPPLLLVAG